APEQRASPAHPRQPQTGEPPPAHRLPEAGGELGYGCEAVVGLRRERTSDGFLEQSLAPVAHALCPQDRAERRATARRPAGEPHPRPLAHPHLVPPASPARAIRSGIDAAAAPQLLAPH